MLQGYLEYRAIVLPNVHIVHYNDDDDGDDKPQPQHGIVIAMVMMTFCMASMLHSIVVILRYFLNKTLMLTMTKLIAVKHA